MSYLCRKKPRTMKIIGMLMMAVLLMTGCGHMAKQDRTYWLEGAWVLRHAEYPIGGESDFSLEEGGTYCLIYDKDTMLYECRIVSAPSGFVITPRHTSTVTLVDKGGGEWLYLEDDDPHPIEIANDSTVIIQHSGVRYSWVRTDDIYEEWGDEMCHIVASEVKNESVGHNSYVLSSKERQQASYIQWLIMAVGLVVIFAATNYVVYQRRRRQLQLQLQQIQEVKEERPQSVRQAIESVEAAYFASDEYHELQHRIATGQTLKEEDWQGIENQLKKVYPGFGSQLRGLHAMSELEYQVCLLIKLRIAPSDIATVLARDVSTISTVRSRLFKKVFDKKGGAREWDEFVLSIGT